MSAWTMLMLVLPYCVYVFVEHKYGLKAGILTAIMIVIGFGIFVYAKTGALDELFFVDAGFIIGLGAISIKLRDSRWFKMQPTIVNTVLGVYILYLQYWSEPLMVRYLPTLTAFVEDPALLEIFYSDGGQQFLTLLSRDTAIVLLGHAVLNAVAAIKFNNFMWLLVRISIFPIFLLLGAYARVAYGHLFGL